jgi:hypothetical protein
MNANESPHRPGFCPRCGASIPVPDVCVGHWDGELWDEEAKTGCAAGGGTYETVCAGCGAKLVADDITYVYDDAGEITFPKEGTAPELFWTEDDD